MTLPPLQSCFCQQSISAQGHGGCGVTGQGWWMAALWEQHFQQEKLTLSHRPRAELSPRNTTISAALQSSAIDFFTPIFLFYLISSLSSTGFSNLEPGFRTVQHTWFLPDGICLSLYPWVSGTDHNIQAQVVHLGDSVVWTRNKEGQESGSQN